MMSNERGYVIESNLIHDWVTPIKINREVAMAYIEKVDIEGFWGDRHLTLDFHDDVNFLIGPNGSGKTTVINTIAAALTADFQNLDTLPFRTISIVLNDPNTKRKPIVEVKKRERKRMPFASIEYSIKESSKAEAKRYSLDELQESIHIRDYPTSRARFQRWQQSAFSDVFQQLEGLVPTTWLSIHRARGPRFAREERNYEFTVDQKLIEISDSLVRFFSALQKRANDYSTKFQETIFLSLIDEFKPRELFGAIQDFDVEGERSSLIDIFDKFNIPKSNYLNRTNDHFDEIGTVIRNTITEREGADSFSLKLEEGFTLLNSWRIHSVVQEWGRIVTSQQEIYEPRDTFLSILNDMFQRKKLYINERNEIVAQSQSGKLLMPTDLSSGEKQLLIIMGEALLQKGMPWVYIADEPELSLHVNWQVTLVDNLRKMNPASQIVIATHSPDIVSHFSDRIHDMEKLL
tara:strand:- start:1013 stop:2398 length:1386 start_codon:yes stop_codon:yes gene_type:complete